MNSISKRMKKQLILKSNQLGQKKKLFKYNRKSIYFYILIFCSELLTELKEKRIGGGNEDFTDEEISGFVTKYQKWLKVMKTEVEFNNESLQRLYSLERFEW